VWKNQPQIQSRVVLCAHIDAKPGTTGALDNASGVITLMHWERF
jgi:Zn-dependent M28 family amino/carboxypeptidase